ncbi:type I-B CRISPR-associated protein Cas7/Cst2/DevR [Paraclostridium bifermentans]|uniref:type I-B CRISPR-associated protein Cas7/Cst2/DevR n=1 Tax=Paraclostridium bifermentans TaxID=1490 RepID=UPI001C81A71F|nr:type I-B CRISPR-associated protein Cas7/Cst2/DevR [Paraclostridium bifermentans]GIM33283.1 type I-B CRISPR-associated protein Cas7/Cst2/DevR [Paraclostridium bifermentans subsp. muricolitidis]
MKKGLTFTVVAQAQSLNYGEGIGNIAELKKLTRADGNMYTFASRQCLRYDIVRLAADLFDWNLQVVDKSKGTIQFKDNMTIKDSQEMDLFGYMKTAKKDDKDKGGSATREAVVRLSNAISLEAYRSDMDFLNNKGLADRIGEHPNLANVEQHLSYYTYTVTIDLSKVGVDGDIELSNEEKFNRVSQLLEIIKILNRNIRGRQENLSPLFVVGGMYDIANPFFLGRVKVEGDKNGYKVSSNTIQEIVNSTFLGKELKDSTYIGMVEGAFTNKEEFKNIVGENLLTVDKFFNELTKGVKEYYGVN